MLSYLLAISRRFLFLSFCLQGKIIHSLAALAETWDLVLGLRKAC